MKILTPVLVLCAFCFFDQAQSFKLSRHPRKDKEIVKQIRNEPKVVIQDSTTPEIVEDIIDNEKIISTTATQNTPEVTLTTVSTTIEVTTKPSISTTSTNSLEPLEKDIVGIAKPEQTSKEIIKEQKQNILKASESKPEEVHEDLKVSLKEERKKKLCNHCKNGPKCKKFGDCTRCALVCKTEDKKRKARSIKNLRNGSFEDTPQFEMERDSTLVASPNEETVLLPRPNFDELAHEESPSQYYAVGSLNRGLAMSVLLKVLQVEQDPGIDQSIIIVKSKNPVKFSSKNLVPYEETPLLQILTKQLSKSSEYGANLGLDKINKILKNSLEILHKSERAAEENISQEIKEVTDITPFEDQTVGCSKEESEIVPFYPLPNLYNKPPKQQYEKKITMDLEPISEEENSYEDRHNKNPEVIEDVPEINSRHSVNTEEHINKVESILDQISNQLENKNNDKTGNEKLQIKENDEQVENERNAEPTKKKYKHKKYFTEEHDDTVGESNMINENINKNIHENIENKDNLQSSMENRSEDSSIEDKLRTHKKKYKKHKKGHSKGYSYGYRSNSEEAENDEIQESLEATPKNIIKIQKNTFKDDESNEKFIGVEQKQRTHHKKYKKHKKQDKYGYRSNDEGLEDNTNVEHDIRPKETVKLEFKPDHMITLQSRHSVEENGGKLQNDESSEEKTRKMESGSNESSDEEKSNKNREVNKNIAEKDIQKKFNKKHINPKKSEGINEEPFLQEPLEITHRQENGNLNTEIKFFENGQNQLALNEKPLNDQNVQGLNNNLNNFPKIKKVKTPTIEIKPHQSKSSAPAMREPFNFELYKKQKEANLQNNNKPTDSVPDMSVQNIADVNHINEKDPRIEQSIMDLRAANDFGQPSEQFNQFESDNMNARQNAEETEIHEQKENKQEEQIFNVNILPPNRADFFDGSKVEFQTPIISKTNPNLEMIEATHLNPVQNDLVPSIDQDVTMANTDPNQQEIVAATSKIITKDEDIPIEKLITPQEEQLLNNFGQIVPAMKKLDLHSGSDVFFMGNGIKLPLRVVQTTDGTISLTVDIDKLCQCKNISCSHKEEIAETLSKNIVGSHIVNEDEKEPEIKQSTLTNRFNRKKRMPRKKLHKRGISEPINYDVRPLNNGQFIVTKSNELIKESDKGNAKNYIDDGNEELHELMRVRDIIKFKQIQRELEGRLTQLNNKLDKSTKNQNEMLEEGTKTLLGIEGEDKIIQQRINLINDVLAWMKDFAVAETDM